MKSVRLKEKGPSKGSSNINNVKKKIYLLVSLSLASAFHHELLIYFWENLSKPSHFLPSY